MSTKFEQLYEAAIAEAQRNREANKSPGRWSVGDSVLLHSSALARLGMGQYNNRPGVITGVETRRNGSLRYTVVIETGDASKYREMFAEESELRSKSVPAKTASDEYAVITDRKGVQLHPGDRVRIRLYPKGSLEGTVVVSPRTQVVMSDGSTRRALSVRDEVDGTLYELNSKGALKL